MSYANKHNKHGEIFGAALIQESELKRFVEFLAKDFKELSISGKTKDRTKISFSDLEEFIAYPNYEKRKIVAFELSCTNEDKSLDINFKSDRVLFRPESIEYHLRYEEQDWGFRFEDDLVQELKEFQPYYSIFTYLDLTFGFPLLLGFVSVVFSSIKYFLKASGFQGFTSQDYESIGDSGSSEFEGIAWLIPIFLAGFLLNWLRNYLFPVFFLATGRQKKKYKTRRYITYTIFGVIILGIAINIISYFITNYIKND